MMNTKILASGLLFAWMCTNSHAGVLLNDAIFAHDFETISGNSITALVGPDGTKTSNISASLVSPLPFSSQHVQAPNGAAHGSIDTNTRLTTAANSLTFSTFFNNPGSSGAARFLSSFDGGGTNVDVFTLFDSIVINNTRTLRFIVNSGSNVKIASSTATIPVADGLWHQAAVVYQGGVSDGTVRFFFDGLQLGGDVTLAGVNSLPVLPNNWHLLEDTTSVSVPTEYFAGGYYDEAALWYRPLSNADIQSLYTQGINGASTNAVPEPANAVIWLFFISCITARNRIASRSDFPNSQPRTL